jgi:hypothetical protein
MAVILEEQTDVDLSFFFRNILFCSLKKWKFKIIKLDNPSSLSFRSPERIGYHPALGTERRQYAPFSQNYYNNSVANYRGLRRGSQGGSGVVVCYGEGSGRCSPILSTVNQGQIPGLPAAETGLSEQKMDAQIHPRLGG